jgi:predicted transcriptional regulator
MTDDETENVPRKPEEPTPKQVLKKMRPCEPYTVSDIEALFDDISRWTIQRRLETLLEQGEIQKKKHAENRVSWWVSLGIPEDIDSEVADRRLEEHFEKVRSMMEDNISDDSAE